MTGVGTLPHVVVLQLGARLHYGAAAALASVGMLDALYTDICATRGWPRVLSSLPRRLRPAAVQRLLARVPVGVPDARIHAFPWLGLRYWMGLRIARVERDLKRVHQAAAAALSGRVRSDVWRRATHLYVFNTAGLAALHQARKHGLRCIVEQTIAAKSVEAALLTEQQQRFPDWVVEPLDMSLAQETARLEAQEWSLADRILCASPFVLDSVREAGGPASKCRIVPYGVRVAGTSVDRRDRRGPLRVLVAGAVGLRKGAPYALEAARRLGTATEMRAVGHIAVPDRIARRMRRHVDLRGPVPRGDMREHYSWADVLLHPAICEGSATVVYEAMAYGLPVICTPATGSVVRDGREGHLVACGAVDAIVSALEGLHRHREMGLWMGSQALARVREYDIEHYAARLRHAIADTGSMPS
jgi:glycosyltransferase involved in cell wall biosynthesis